MQWHPFMDVHGNYDGEKWESVLSEVTDSNLEADVQK